MIACSFVHGNSLCNHIAVIIYPEPKQVLKVLAENDITIPGDEEEQFKKGVHHTAVKSFVQAELARIAKTNAFNGLERPKSHFALVDEEFKVGVILTPTMKLQRKKAREFFSTQISEIYGNLSSW